MVQTYNGDIVAMLTTWGGGGGGEPNRAGELPVVV